MILVTLGTQKQQFTRLIECVENLNIKEKIIVQAGHTKFVSNKIEIHSFFTYEEMEEYVNDARIIITHAGTGSIITPLKKEKIVIACARLKKYGEHLDNHQEQIVEIFDELKYIIKFKDGDDLNKIVKKARNFKPNKFISNSKNFRKTLKNVIDNI